MGLTSSPTTQRHRRLALQSRRQLQPPGLLAARVIRTFRLRVADGQPKVAVNHLVDIFGMACGEVRETTAAARKGLGKSVEIEFVTKHAKEDEHVIRKAEVA